MDLSETVRQQRNFSPQVKRENWRKHHSTSDLSKSPTTLRPPTNNNDLYKKLTVDQTLETSAGLDLINMTSVKNEKLRPVSTFNHQEMFNDVKEKLNLLLSKRMTSDPNVNQTQSTLPETKTIDYVTSPSEQFQSESDNCWTSLTSTGSPLHLVKDQEKTTAPPPPPPPPPQPVPPSLQTFSPICTKSMGKQSHIRQRNPSQPPTQRCASASASFLDDILKQASYLQCDFSMCL